MEPQSVFQAETQAKLFSIELPPWLCRPQTECRHDRSRVIPWSGPKTLTLARVPSSCCRSKQGGFSRRTEALERGARVLYSSLLNHMVQKGFGSITLALFGSIYLNKMGNPSNGPAVVKWLNMFVPT